MIGADAKAVRFNYEYSNCFDEAVVAIGASTTVLWHNWVGTRRPHPAIATGLTTFSSWVIGTKEAFPLSHTSAAANDFLRRRNAHLPRYSRQTLMVELSQALSRLRENGWRVILIQAASQERKSPKVSGTRFAARPAAIRVGLACTGQLDHRVWVR